MSGQFYDNDDVNIKGQLTDGYQPNPAMAVIGEGVPTVDASNRLETRAAALTDEGSFRDDFSGAALSAEWTPTTSGAGSSVTVANSLVSVVVGSGNTKSAQIFRAADYLPYNMQGSLTVSQRIANQTTLFGFLDDAGTTSKQALFEFSGTTNTSVICRSSSSSAAADTQSTTITLPAGNTSTAHIYRIDVTATYVAFSIDDVIVATHQSHIPGPYDFLGNVLSITNATGSPASTTVSMDWFSLANVNQVDTTNSFKEAILVKDYPFPATYAASVTGLVTANNATDIFTITGSANKIVKVTRVHVDGTSSNQTTVSTQLIRRSTANSGGTSTTPSTIPYDTSSIAATAVVRAYTANPTLGTMVGMLRSDRMFVPTTSGIGDEMVYEFGPSKATQPITLRGTNEVLAVNLSSTTVNGPLFNLSIEWTEE